MAAADMFWSESLNADVRAIERVLNEIAPTNIPLLLLGESGTGKEMVALRVHRLSECRNQSFVKVICAMLGPDSLGESSHDGDREDGIDSLVGAGTVFLDEICDLDPEFQPKLLHVLPDSGAVRHDGCLKARVISASSRNLEEQIRQGRFRQELFYRLNGVCLRIPPLRQRREDIPGFIDYFLNKYSAQFARPKPTLSHVTLHALIEHAWPGNIRQLENTIKRIVALGDEQLAMIAMEAVGLESKLPGTSEAKLSLKEASRAASRQAEKELILEALQRTHWNRKRAAKDLQISYKALLYKLKQIGLEDSATISGTRREQE